MKRNMPLLQKNIDKRIVKRFKKIEVLHEEALIVKSLFGPAITRKIYMEIGAIHGLVVKAHPSMAHAVGRIVSANNGYHFKNAQFDYFAIHSQHAFFDPDKFLFKGMIKPFIIDESPMVKTIKKKRNKK